MNSPRKKSTRRASRRNFLAAAGGAVLAAAGVPAALAQVSSPGRSAPAPQSLVAARIEAIRRVTGGATVNRGKVTLDLPQLVDNGNAVALAIKVDSPMTATEYVRAIHVFTEKNPQPDVATFKLTPDCGRAQVSTRMRLADTQTVLAICELSDGSFWSGSADAVVTLAACLEEI
jgi:sulfur-oxidizing protein SoxY